MANIKVAVRVRPISARELKQTGSAVVVRTDLNGISLTNLKVSSSKAGDSRERTRRYGFDYCFDSSNPEAEYFADQARIYETLGQSVLDAVFSGYNSCLVAYGQSASGKTYTMMGTKEDPGLTPRLCEGIFSRIEGSSEKTYCVSVSYLEIYNERVRDLLKPSSSTSGLRVREHPRLGPYVQGLTHHVVRTLGSLMSYVEEGTKARKTASTLQNPSSSRSHALLTIAVSPESSDLAVGSGYSSSRRSRGGSKLRLVDLAGSESAATCSGVHRLKEGANINKSLVALGNVISALAERGSAGSGPGRRFIPYRDSSLTWLLKDALGGNATTIMLATISPSSGSYNETAHTLRFAQRAQSVVNRPVVNEDPVARVIRELRAEVARLKLLLLEKNIDSNACCCWKDQAKDPGYGGLKKEEEEQDVDSRSRESQTETKIEERRSRSIVLVRRSNSTDSVVACEADTSLKRFGSCEILARDRFESNYNRAKVTELNDEVHESVFVDIPTLVAVLIKPDDSLQDSSAQIEEICSDEATEDAIDVEFIEASNDREVFEEQDKQESIDGRSSSVNSCHASGDNEAYVYQTCDLPSFSSSGSKLKEKPKFRKQDSVDILPTSILSNLHTSKKFGSVEAIQKKKEPFFPLERSHTNLENTRSLVSDRAKKLNNIREIDDRKNGGRNAWRGSKDQLQRKSSNESDKSLKEAAGQIGAKSKNYARKPSLENLKRKTSKDSSSSSSKDEQILISNLGKQRKNSLDQELPSVRAHTPIQRAKRSEIVAAVTERLYASRKAAEEASGVRSPPESADVKSVSKMKLQEISRKMLGKRRRVCVDTQTDILRTVRTKDTASLTETPQVIHQDVGVLTDDHEVYKPFDNQRTPVLRVKEIATSTDKPKTSIVRCRDVASLANDLEEFDYEIHSPRNDSGILSDDTQNYAESNLSSTEVSDICQEADRRIHTDSSTNTLYSSCRSFAVQTPRLDPQHRRKPENKAPVCSRQCCNPAPEPQNRSPVDSPEKSVISISLPDTINITIESTNGLESRIAVTSNLEQEKQKSNTKDGEVQTDASDDVGNEVFRSDLARSTLSQTDGRVFRIENIFQDPNNASKVSKADVTAEGTRMRNSITLRNSLGTSYVSQPKKIEDSGSLACGRHGDGFIRDGLITEAFITKKRSFNSRRPSAAVYDDQWRKWATPEPVNTIRSIDYARGLETVPATWQLRPSEIPVASFAVSCANCANSAENGGTFQRYQTSSSEVTNAETSEAKPSFFTVLETNNNVEHDHSFSDDSLDYNESNAFSQATTSKPKQADSREQRESLCPPDVVAHTKKDCPKSTSPENVESVDADDSHVELPKKKPAEPTEIVRIHDYESLILGRPCYSYEDANEELDAPSNRENNAGKKKVSFSSSGVPEKRVVQAREDSKQGSQAILKSIIKKKKRRSSTELSSAVQSSNDETDDSQQGEKSSLTSESDWREEVPATSFEEREGQDSVDFGRDSKQKKVKFSADDLSENTCSESDSCENAEDDEEDVSYDRATRNIIEEYLGEAATFMRNLNSINEYVNIAGMLRRCATSTPPERSRKRGTRRRSCSSAWNRDYAEFMDRKTSPKDDIDINPKDTDGILSTDAYERCLKGIQSLEGCIRRVGKHNELLREKYGVNCESAGARLDLASPSTDRTPTASKGFAISRETDVPFVGGSSVPKESNRRNEEDDLEKRIFDQLMNVANSARYRGSGKLRNRFSDLSDLKSPSSSTYSKFRHDRATKEPFCGDVRGSFDLDETSPDNDEAQDFTRYEITGNLSVARSGSSQGNVDDDLEDEFLPLRRFDRAFWSVDATSVEKRLQGDSPGPNRSSTIDSGIDDSFSLEKLNLGTSFPVQRSWTADTRDRFREIDYSRKTKDDTKVCGCSRDQSDPESSSDIAYFRDKLKHPGSPRARFLELLKERRRIVESSRGTSAS